MRANRTRRPYIVLNAAMSLDGKIATSTGDSQMSSPEDLRRVHRLRASVDGIMVGFRTLMVDDPKLTVKHVRGPNPTRVIVDSNAGTPLDSYVVKTAKDIRTIIAVTARAPKKRIEALQRKGATVLICGEGPLVSLKTLLNLLGRLGLQKILLEGGGTLNWNMLRNGLVDEVSVAITPRILGGTEAVSLVAGEGVRLVRDSVKLKLLGASRYGPDLVVRYRVIA
ncbi:2,5-diamino-6-(ribosylamino)-4(3H)-pyrimidinone 5'-phosphate reductase [Candidatus Bathyarchaeota archaeon]|nr:2,5-diamino-6-(ribosylamino)-4(3H)-pyrimidinone 5'-phosphate reductase [Candidatus Bathyarchaeota archaeon]